MQGLTRNPFGGLDPTILPRYIDMTTLASPKAWPAMAATLRAPAADATTPTANITEVVSKVLRTVKHNGDEALVHYAKAFDQTDLTPTTMRVHPTAADVEVLSTAERDAVQHAIENVEAFHAKQLHDIHVETAPGVVCQRLFRPLARVGLYIPAGSAPLASTMIMLAVPARIAGVEDIVLCSPLQKGSRAARVMLAVASMLGLSSVYTIGGAQAIAAMAFGTATVPAVEKILGPGNAYVTEAKRQVLAQGTAIDMLAGPSEVMVIADHDANPVWVAADLLAQAEHDPNALTVLVTPSQPLIRAVMATVTQQLASLPRAPIAAQALRQGSVILVASLQNAVHAANAYAPEHLSVHADQPTCAALLPHIRTAGSTFLGGLAAEALGDYASGANHVLPTGGSAAWSSGVSVHTFGRMMSVQSVTEAGFRTLAPTVMTLAGMEELEGHKRSIMVRLAASTSPAPATEEVSS